MAVNPINITRVTNNLRTNFVIDSLRQSQLETFRTQERISTGRSFVTPSDDPVAASRALDLNQTYADQNQLLDDLNHANNVLTASDSSISEISSLLIEASTIASQNAGDLTSADERAAEAELIVGIRQQLMVVGNRVLDGRFIFGGRRTGEQPFVDALGGIAYVGDIGELHARIEPGKVASISVPGNQLFGALSSQITGDVDLTPRVSPSTRLEDLDGANGEGIRLGQLIINEAAGAGRVAINLTGADTIGNVADAINAAAAAAGAGFTAEVTDSGITVTPGGAAITATDTSTGVVASDLGILIAAETSQPIAGADLHARVSRLTPVEDLARGAGIDLESGLIITNGSRTVTVDFTGATTVQDIINRINNAGAYTLARISDDGSRIDVFNQVSGTSMSIGENGGTTATDLGIRTMSAATTLDELNFGAGVVLRDGVADLSITAKNGSTFEVNFDGASTIGDVIDAINAAAVEAGVSVTASFADTGNGIVIDDSTGGTGDLIVAAANLSQAAMDLGIEGVASGTETRIGGGDVNPTRTEGILDALFDLERALRNDDTAGLTTAAGRIDTLREEVVRVHGIVGARAQSMGSKIDQMRDAAITTQRFLSEVEDLDYAEAVTRLNAAQVQLQASLQTSAQLLSLSLMDFLG